MYVTVTCQTASYALVTRKPVGQLRSKRRLAAAVQVDLRIFGCDTLFGALAMLISQCRVQRLFIFAAFSAVVPGATLAQFDHIPLYFEANQGQASPRVRYLARSGNVKAFITDEGVTV